MGLLESPLNNAVLQNHLKGCAALERLCRNITNEFFPLTPEEEEAKKKYQEEQRKRADPTEFPDKRKHLTIAAAVAVLAFGTFAYMNGLLPFSSGESSKG